MGFSTRLYEETPRPPPRCLVPPDTVCRLMSGNSSPPSPWVACVSPAERKQTTSAELLGLTHTLHFQPLLERGIDDVGQAVGPTFVNEREEARHVVRA